MLLEASKRGGGGAKAAGEGTLRSGESRGEGDQNGSHVVSALFLLGPLRQLLPHEFAHHLFRRAALLQPLPHPDHHLLVAFAAPDPVAAHQQELHPFPPQTHHVRSRRDDLLAGLQGAAVLVLQVPQRAGQVQIAVDPPADDAPAGLPDAQQFAPFVGFVVVAEGEGTAAEAGDGAGVSGVGYVDGGVGEVADVGGAAGEFGGPELGGAVGEGDLAALDGEELGPTGLRPHDAVHLVEIFHQGLSVVSLFEERVEGELKREVSLHEDGDFGS